jgi:hypothetical protein
VARAEELARDPAPGDRTDRRPLAREGRGDEVAALAGRVRPTDLARDRRLPVVPALDGLLPAAGLRRGTTAAVDARPGVAGATSLALALAAGASQAGSWVAAVGLGSLGLVAAAEMGVAFERLVVIADPGGGRAGWASVVAALADGFDVVLVAAGGGAAGGAAGGGRLRPADARRLVARVRERGAVLVAVGGDLPERSHVRLSVEAGAWEGLEPTGLGRLSARRAVVVAGGRGEASRPRRAHLWLPSATGEVAPADPMAPAVPLDRHRRSATSEAGEGRSGRSPATPLRPAEGEGWGDLVGTAG